MPAVTGWICTPSHARLTWPCSLSWATTIFAVRAGMSKPMPTEPPEGEKMAVFTPITFPLLLNAGPPELPLLMGASIWM